MKLAAEQRHVLATGPAKRQSHLIGRQAFCSTPFHPAAATAARACPRDRIQLRCAASKGFGKSNAKKGGSKASEKLSTRVRPGEALSEDWIRVCSLQELQESPKPTKPIILATGTALVLYYVDGEVYCSDAYSTAYKYPLADAAILQRPGGPAVEVPLDGTVYDLDTGKVLEWCPKNSAVRAVLGQLKSKSDPVKLPVYGARVVDNNVYVKLTQS